MPWDIALLAGTAAAAGLAVRRLAGFLAKKTGHTPDEGKDAVASNGLSLILDDDDNSDNAQPRPHKRVRAAH